MQICLSPPDLENLLEEELENKILDRRERLFFVPDGTVCHWAANTWFDVEEFTFNSISEAAKHLRSQQRNWWLHSTVAHRRAQLIQDQLPPMKAKPVLFPGEVPKLPLGSWTLLDESKLLSSARCSRIYPDGEVRFLEDKQGPPSRAYLKLWEYFLISQRQPGPGERVIDLGSSPGGWTWVLDQLGAEVISVDRAPLASTMKISKRVQFKVESAFALDPKDFGPLDWLFSDVICYPERLLELVHKWKDHVANMVCTIKFQYPTNHKIVAEFLKIPNSQAQHLSHNKHELTWSRLKAL